MTRSRRIVFASLCICMAGWAAGAMAAGAPGERVPESAAARTAAVASVLDDWHAAGAAADEGRYFGHFAPGAVFLGTDASERWTVEEFRRYAHPYFAKGKAWTFRAVSRHVAFSQDGFVAWFDEALDTPNLGPSRGSGVLLRTPTGWKIAHYDLSVPIPNDLMKEVKERIAKSRRGKS